MKNSILKSVSPFNPTPTPLSVIEKTAVDRKVDLTVLLKEMPPFIARTHPRFKELTGYSGRTMANMDCLKQTTAIKKIMLGNTVAYDRESLVRWLEARARIVG